MVTTYKPQHKALCQALQAPLGLFQAINIRWLWQFFFQLANPTLVCSMTNTSTLSSHYSKRCHTWYIIELVSYDNLNNLYPKLLYLAWLGCLIVLFPPVMNTWISICSLIVLYLSPIIITIGLLIKKNQLGFKWIEIWNPHVVKRKTISTSQNTNNQCIKMMMQVYSFKKINVIYI